MISGSPDSPKPAPKYVPSILPLKTSPVDVSFISYVTTPARSELDLMYSSLPSASKSPRADEVEFVCVGAGVGVRVYRGVLVAVEVAVGLGVLVDVAVGVAVLVRVAVLVGVAVAVFLGVFVAVEVFVGVAVLVGVDVGVSVGV